MLRRFPSYKSVYDFIMQYCLSSIVGENVAFLWGVVDLIWSIIHCKCNFLKNKKNDWKFLSLTYCSSSSKANVSSTQKILDT